MPARVSGLACWTRSRTFWSPTPTFSASRRRSRQWQPPGDPEAVVVGLDLGGQVGAEVGLRPVVLVVPGVADPPEEQQREDVRLEVGRVDGAAQAVGGGPQARFEFLLGQGGREWKLGLRQAPS